MSCQNATTSFTSILCFLIDFNLFICHFLFFFFYFVWLNISFVVSVSKCAAKKMKRMQKQNTTNKMFADPNNKQKKEICFDSYSQIPSDKYTLFIYLLAYSCVNRFNLIKSQWWK